jgi:tRNA (mo5U34)-methyltransferase
MTPAERIAELDWWHTIEIEPGLVTRGGWDLRPTADVMPWPDLAGKRCLDVGTMDGFWAFELERRGASEVLAIDVLDPQRLDTRVFEKPGRRPSERNFALVAELLGSSAALRDLSVYDLDPADIGRFDVIVMGYVLQMLRDPLRALDTLRTVCRGHLVLLDTISVPLELLPSPLARLDARRDGSEWFVFNRRGLRKALRLSGWTIEQTTPVIRDRPGPAIARRELTLRPRFLHRVGIRGRSAALLARPSTL